MNIDELKDKLVESLNHAPQSLVDAVAHSVYMDGKNFPKEMVQEHVRKTISMDFLESAAELLKDFDYE